MISYVVCLHARGKFGFIGENRHFIISMGGGVITGGA
jgi:hypothetical protein